MEVHQKPLFFTIITMIGVGYGVKMNCKLLFNTQHWWRTNCFEFTALLCRRSTVHSVKNPDHHPEEEEGFDWFMFKLYTCILLYIKPYLSVNVTGRLAFVYT